MNFDDLLLERLLKGYVGINRVLYTAIYGYKWLYRALQRAAVVVGSGLAVEDSNWLGAGTSQGCRAGHAT